MNPGKLNERVISCRKCARLVEYRNSMGIPRRYSGENYWNKPITGHGDINGRILAVGLAPAFNGGNRTGRIFTGDKSSDFLISSMYEVGLTNIPTSERTGDGLEYNDMYITLALRCAPPDNKPLKSELENCRGFIENEIRLMKNLKVILSIGKIAFDSVINDFKSRGIKISGIRFSHGTHYDISGISVYCSYHPSPRNVNTGLLKKEDFISLLREIRNYVD